LISNKELLNDWIRRNSRLEEAEAGDHRLRDNEVLSGKSPLIYGSTDVHGIIFAQPASQLRERDVHHINEEVRVLFSEAQRRCYPEHVPVETALPNQHPQICRRERSDQRQFCIYLETWKRLSKQNTFTFHVVHGM
jgi:hypothetical protein